MAYQPPHKYTARQLDYATLRDLVVDIRCARRDGMSDYAEQCAAKFRRLWASRHGSK